MVVAHAQIAGEYEVKAAFLFNFIKFVEWPTEAYKTASDPIAICVLGENPFGRTLDEAVAGKSVLGRRLVVRQILDSGHATGCQILFVSGTEKKRWRAIAESVKSSGILTIGESGEFIASGGVINFKLEGGKVRFQINLEAAERSNLRVSSKLLNLAQIVEK